MSGAIGGYVWVLWDLLAVAVLALFIHISAERGFVRTVICFAGYIVAALLADLVSPMLSEALYDGIVKDAIRLVILNRLGDLAGDAAADLADAIPQGLARLMEDGSINSLSGVLDSEAARIVEELVDAALREPVLSILNSICFLLVFTVALLLVRHLSRLLRGVYKVPLIGTADTVLGGIVGILEAAVVLIVASLVLRILIGVSGGWVWLDGNVMDDTYIWRIFWNTTNFMSAA